MSEERTDAIMPTQIEHLIDEIWVDGRLEQYYNFLDYHFEAEGAYCRARAYVDDFREITLFGPFEKRGSIAAVVAPDFAADVGSYLERPFLQIRRL